MVSPERAEYKRQWQRENKDKARAALIRYREKNPGLMAKKAKEYRARNAEKVREMKPHWARKTAYGIEREEYEKLLSDQKERCAICYGVNKDGKALGVDHDHGTGRIRGLLCNTCNRSLGLLHDNIEVLKKAIKYLEFWKS